MCLSIILLIIIYINEGYFISSPYISYTLVFIFLIGLVMYLYAKYMEIKLQRLKKNGMRYEAEIKRIIPSLYFKIKGYRTFVIQCSYHNNTGKECIAKSKLVSLRKSSKLFYFDNSVLMPDTDYRVTVYENSNNSYDCFVEVCAEIKSNLWFR